ncbi:M48 family metalloprotease [Neptunicoccus sediminis]|uniref:M48 family metalloprotease n=1 Tax=Neptunicoccus sediminis TaxID=1892596 RepID=UPI00084612C1|nr:M48 family metalloprotease [Neptunicoccus sediminis]
MPRLMQTLLTGLCLSGLVFLAACTENDRPAPPLMEAQTAPVIAGQRNVLLSEGLIRFSRVHKRLLPVAKRACQKAHPEQKAARCAFQFVVALDRGNPPDAKFTRDGAGRPVIVFNHAMVKFLKTDDEFAMVMAHEMAHQIARHITRGQEEVLRGAMNSAKTAKAEGRDVNQAARYGAQRALASYTKQFEYEADRNGTILMMAAGYNPDQAITLLNRLPKSSGRTSRHPADPDRINKVRALSRQIRDSQSIGRKVPLLF